MSKFEVGQAVILLDGTSLVGRIIAVGDLEFAGELMPTYKVSIGGSTGRWYDAAELAPTAPSEPQPNPVTDGAAEAGDGKPTREVVADLLSTILALTEERDTLKAALEPFARQWRGWQDYAKEGGTDDVIGYFTDCLEPEVLARWLKQAQQAQQSGAVAGSVAG